MKRRPMSRPIKTEGELRSTIPREVSRSFHSSSAYITLALVLILIMTAPAPTLESNLWWTRVKIDLYNKKLLRWVIDTGPSSSSSPGNIVPDRMTDPEGYITWKETYLSVEATLHSCLSGMLPVVLADPRYAGLWEECKMLQRVGVIRAVYADYDLVRTSLGEWQADSTGWCV